MLNRDELNRMMDANLEAGENNFSAVKFLSFGKSDQTPKLAFRSLSQIGEYFKSGIFQRLMYLLVCSVERSE